MSLRYAIVGTGAIGGYYGGRLANSGSDVHFLFHSDYEHVAANGLKVDSVNGNFVINPINAYKSTADMPECDVVLVGLKSTQNHFLPQLLPPLLKSSTLVVLIQNGLGLEHQLADALPNQPIAGYWLKLKTISTKPVCLAQSHPTCRRCAGANWFGIFRTTASPWL